MFTFMFSIFFPPLLKKVPLLSLTSTESKTTIAITRRTKNIIEAINHPKCVSAFTLPIDALIAVVIPLSLGIQLENRDGLDTFEAAAAAAAAAISSEVDIF